MPEGNQRVDALLLSGNSRDAVGNLGGDGNRQTLKRSIHAGAPRCSGSAESGKASSGQLPGVVCNLCCLGDNSVGHEGEQTVRTFEVDDNLFSVVFNLELIAASLRSTPSVMTSNRSEDSAA